MDVHGSLLAHLRPVLLKHRARDPQIIAQEVMALAKGKGLCENTAVVVIKFTGLGPPPARGSRSSPSKMAKFSVPAEQPPAVEI